MEQTPEETTRMNNELLKVAKPEDESPEVKKPKRNSKEELLSKILRVVEKYELEFDYSDTRLKRMKTGAHQGACKGDGGQRKNRHGQERRRGP